MKAVVFTLTFFILALMICLYFGNISRSGSDIDDFQVLVDPIRPFVSAHTLLTYLSNDPSKELFFKIQMAMITVLLEKDQIHDTLLLVRDTTNSNQVPIPDSIPFRVIAANTKDHFTVSLITINK